MEHLQRIVKYTLSSDTAKSNNTEIDTQVEFSDYVAGEDSDNESKKNEDSDTESDIIKIHINDDDEHDEYI